MKTYTNEYGHITNIATMPIYAKNLKKSSSPEPINRWHGNLICSFVYASTTKIVQIMTLDWPWPILHQGQIWLHRLLYGRKWIFMHSAKWVNEVEWVSKVKVILWPWPKVIQISKLNVWLWPVYSGERFRASWPSCLVMEAQESWSFAHILLLTWTHTRTMHYFILTDSIEANVEHAEIHVSEGTQQLSKARDYQVCLLWHGIKSWTVTITFQFRAISLSEMISSSKIRFWVYKKR